MWRVAEPNEALIISGLRRSTPRDDGRSESLGFKIVTGKGTLVIPGVQTVRRLSLDLREAELGHRLRHPPGHPARRSGAW